MEAAVVEKAPLSSSSTPVTSPVTVLPTSRGRGRPRKPADDAHTEKLRQRYRREYQQKLARLNDPRSKHVKQEKIAAAIAANQRYKERHPARYQATQKAYYVRASQGCSEFRLREREERRSTSEGNGICRINCSPAHRCL